MPNTNPTSADREDVVLMRPGVGRESYHLSARSTVRDLLREAGTELRGQDVMIEGRAEVRRVVGE